MTTGRVTVIATIVVVVKMLTKVIPVFEKMFKDFGGHAARADADGHHISHCCRRTSST